MEGLDACAIQDLLATGGARSENRDARVEGALPPCPLTAQGSVRCPSGSRPADIAFGSVPPFAGRSEERLRRCCNRTADGGEKDHFADGHRGLVVLPLVAEGTGHATAAAGNDVELSVGQQGTQDSGRLLNADERLLVAMTMEPNLQDFATEGVGGDAAGCDFAGEELVV